MKAITNYLFFLFVVPLQVFVVCERARYDNYRLYSLLVETANQTDVLHTLATQSDSYTFLESVSKDTEHNASVIVPPHKFAEFSSLLMRYNFKYVILNYNLEGTIANEQIHFRQRRATTFMSWEKYHRLDVIYKWMKTLSKTMPDRLKLLEVGTTYECRKIVGIRLSYREGNPGVVLEGGIHAREWIAPAVVTYILNQLIHSNETHVREIAESYDWYVIPILNPDGYEYSHTTNRFWRKTRKPFGKVCYGADPNRNWDHHWGEVGYTTNFCSDSYPGDKPFSEIETKSTATFLKALKGKLHAYIAFHSYSQLLLFPFGYTGQHAPNHDDLQRIGNKAATALAKRYGTKYKVGNIHKTIYPVSGSSMEWAYDTLNTKIAFTYELRPLVNNSFGFTLPPQQIIPTGEETLDSLTALLNEAKSMGYFKID